MTVATKIAPPRSTQLHKLLPALVRCGTLAALTLCTLFVHGYHPFAEDGGIYAAGIESILNPSLFPHDRAFVTGTSRYSLFSALAAHISQIFHIPLPWLLFAIYILGIVLTLYAAWRIAEQCFHTERTKFFAVALIAAWFTIPVAGTSLLLMDPSVTARTLSTPLSLLAIGFALSFDWDVPSTRLRSLVRCVLCLAIAAATHMLMAAYAAAFVLALLVAKLPTRRARIFGWITLAASALLTAGVLQTLAPAESVPVVAATFSRYYWFLSQWQWYELLGLAGPLIVLALLHRFAQLPRPAAALCRAAIAIGSIATLVSLLFAHRHYNTHLVARLQPLRAFLPIYAIMIVLLGGVLGQACIGKAPLRRFTSTLPPLILAALMCTMFLVQRDSFPGSQHLELPWRPPTNAWSQAFLWARDNTPPTAIFAIDANYIQIHGEDAQTFRATAQRSILPDFSKDGGEASINPALADPWFTGFHLQQDLSSLTDQQRIQRLQPLGVTWLILQANAPTAATCPYENAAVKVCRLPPRIP